jgi:Raf kinase inhibitor-like YbhB/YbcL family protein
MVVTSSAFEANGTIPAKYTCDGENINPPIRIAGAPTGTETLVLVMDDPDAPAGTFDHWLVWNIPGSTEEVPEGWKPEAGVSEGVNGFGKVGYGGPCPPSGTHRYVLRVYALSRRLNLAASATKQQVETAASEHALDRGELIGVYSKRSK